jgi:glutamine synthetase
MTTSGRERMRTREVRSIEQALALIDERGLSHVKMGFSDIDGILRGQTANVVDGFRAINA